MYFSEIQCISFVHIHSKGAFFKFSSHQISCSFVGWYHAEEMSWDMLVVKTQGMGLHQSFYLLFVLVHMEVL